MEIVSPSNSREEMDEKIGLFFAAGAIEVWLVDETGSIRFFTSEGEQPDSGYPVKIERLL